MDTIRTADLPDGSIVVGRELPGHREVVCIKDHPTRFSAWRCTNGSHVGDWFVDRLIGGGDYQVLRVGSGS
ncbi:hypothetical protein ABT369_39610 [Dactylosporangium sp. NPDC000244]|uniref:hypothetical protein n=1 Tax=Dactylosporangium sp. NPDC000244 TaxID=3154365 RepID=UPI003332E93D